MKGFLPKVWFLKKKKTPKKETDFLYYTKRVLFNVIYEKDTVFTCVTISHVLGYELYYLDLKCVASCCGGLVMSPIQLFATPWTTACQAPCDSPSPRICSDLCPLSQWCHPTISSFATPFFFCLHSFPTSGSFPVGQLCIRWPEHWSFSFSISPSNESSGLISFRTDWFDLLAVRGTLKGLI